MRIVLRREDRGALIRGKRIGAQVVVSDGWEIAGPTLFAGAPIPWDLVEYGFHFVERWDAAAPLWRYGVLAADVAVGAERERTEKLVRDLRLMLYAPELLFVQDSPAGRELVRVWREEVGTQKAEGRMQNDGERLAFLRALYVVKPRFCVLPRGWLLEDGAAATAGNATVAAAARRARRRGEAPALVQVEIAPGRYVCCPPDEVEAYRARFAKMREKRR